MFRETLRRIYFHRHVLWDMAIKQLKAKYAGSILGISWAIVTPFLIMSAITFVFSGVFKIEVKNFHLFVLAGILPWMFFSGALYESAFSILSQKNILRQFNLPRQVIPLGAVLSNFLNFLISWSIIYPLFFFFNSRIILLLPLLLVILVLHFLFVCGLGLVLSVLNVFFRDVSQLLEILLMFWFWVTPVFYSPDMIPEHLRWICNLNPMAPYILYYRDIVFAGNVPSLSIFVGVFSWAMTSLFFGFLFFSHFEQELLKRI